MGDMDIQWHPGFVAAMNLELADNRDGLIYEKEYNLNVKPLEIDLLVIKKDKKLQIRNEIGRFFRGHNIMEYKSPDDHLDIDTFYKSGAYASLYKAYGETVDERAADDITVSIVREGKPTGLFGYFQSHGIRVENPYGGIYYVKDGVLFPTQIIATRELDKRSHIWLKALSGKMEKQDMKQLLENVDSLTKKFDRELADAVLEVSVKANQGIVDELKGDNSMCQALLEIMEPEINKIVEAEVNKVVEAERKKMEEERKKIVEEERKRIVEEERKIIADERKKSIFISVKGFRDLGISDDKILEVLKRNYGFSMEEAGEYL